MKPAFIYSFKVWVTSLLFGPLVYYLTQLITEPQYFHHFIYLIKYPALFSIPGFVIAFLAVLLINNTRIKLNIKKLIVSIIAIVLILMPLYIIDNGFSIQSITYGIAYGSVTLAAIWLYQIK